MAEDTPSKGLLPEDAFILMQQGIWMTSGGYTWRNTSRGDGEYWAYGEYPGCIRSCTAHTVDQMRCQALQWQVSPRWLYHMRSLLPRPPLPPLAEHGRRGEKQAVQRPFVREVEEAVGCVWEEANPDKIIDAILCFVKCNEVPITTLRGDLLEENAAQREILQRLVLDWDGEPEDMAEAREALATPTGEKTMSEKMQPVVKQLPGWWQVWDTAWDVGFYEFRADGRARMLRSNFWDWCYVQGKWERVTNSKFLRWANTDAKPTAVWGDPDYFAARTRDTKTRGHT